DFIRGTAALVNVRDTLLEIYTGLDSAEHLIARTEDAFKEREFFREELKDALVGCVCLIEEIDHDHIMLLPVTMTAADALLDALRVPRQVVVHHERAELQVDAFRASFRSNHDFSLFAEVVYQGGAHVSGTRTGDAICSLVPI